TERDRVFGDGEDDGDRRGCRLGGQRWSGASARNDHGNRSTNQFGRQRRQSIKLVLGPAIFDHCILPLDEACLLQTLAKCAQAVRVSVGRRGVKKPYHRHRGLLGARRERPRSRAAEQRYELAALHSITSSASALAVERRTHCDLGAIIAGAVQSFGRISTTNTRSGRFVLFCAVWARFPVSK